MSSTAPEAPVVRAAEVRKLSLIVAQLLALGWVIPRLDLEPYIFARELWWSMIAAHVVHHFLPRGSQPTFFLAFSVFAIGFVFHFPDSAWIVGVAVAYFAICHLPVRVSLRAVILGLAMIMLAAMRLGVLAAPWSAAVWPILASILMFRTVVYLRDVSSGRVPAGDAGALAYFFLFPNVAFPLFPIVDYSAYRRRFYDRDAFAIYQRGVETILRGFIHLLVYRIVVHYVVTAPEDVIDARTLALHLVGNFALVLRVSGQFHLVVGVLHLFGFRLPRIMNLFFLATSFSDFLRRVNVYWKDFVQKLVFYPVFLRVRSWSEARRFAAATLIAFLVTWFLHSYQWFWIQGRFLVSAMDVAFWASLGALVLVNALVDARRQSAKVLRGHEWTAAELFSRGLRAMGTFLAIAVLWSLWVSESFADWLALWAAARLDVASVLVTLVVAIVAFVLATAVFSPAPMADDDLTEDGALVSRFCLRTLLPASVVFAVVLFPEAGPETRVAEVLNNLRVSRLGARDDDLLTRGYYEDLTDVARFSPELWNVYLKQRSDGAPAHAAGPPIGSERHKQWANRKRSLTLNRWGMRDRDYEQEKPAGTYRIAVLGGSGTMGSGVPMMETYENVAEDRLNLAALPPGVKKVEILNFAWAGLSVLQQVGRIEKALSFAPDALVYAGHAADRARLVSVLSTHIREGRKIPYPFVAEVITEVGATKEVSKTERLRRLNERRDVLAVWAYRQLVERCREHGVEPFYLYVPVPREVEAARPQWFVPSFVEPARAAGFRILDLSDAYRGEDPRSLRIAEGDDHVNAKGHRILAGRLAEVLLSTEGLLSAATQTAETGLGN